MLVIDPVICIFTIEGSTSRLCRLITAESLLYPLSRRVAGPLESVRTHWRGDKSLKSAENRKFHSLGPIPTVLSGSLAIYQLTLLYIPEQNFLL